MAQCTLISRPVPIDTPHTFVSRTLSCSLQRTLQFGFPLRYCIPQALHVVSEAWTGQRRVDANNNIGQHINSCAPLGGNSRNRIMLLSGVNASPFVTPDDAQETTVLHRIQEMRSGL